MRVSLLSRSNRRKLAESVAAGGRDVAHLRLLFDYMVAQAVDDAELKKIPRYLAAIIMDKQRFGDALADLQSPSTMENARGRERDVYPGQSMWIKPEPIREDDRLPRICYALVVVEKKEPIKVAQDLGISVEKVLASVAHEKALRSQEPLYVKPEEAQKQKAARRAEIQRQLYDRKAVRAQPTKDDDRIAANCRKAYALRESLSAVIKQQGWLDLGPTLKDPAMRGALAILEDAGEVVLGDMDAYGRVKTEWIPVGKRGEVREKKRKRELLDLQNPKPRKVS